MHWYDLDGNLIDFSLRSKANKKLFADGNVMPSITSVIGQLGKPGLEKWKQEQVILAALTLPRENSETDMDFAKRIIEDSREKSKQAAELGSTIHNLIERRLKKENIQSTIEANILI